MGFRDGASCGKVVELPEDSGFPAFVAQRIEHLTTDQKVGGSSPSKRTKSLNPTSASLKTRVLHKIQNNQIAVRTSLVGSRDLEFVQGFNLPI